MLPPSGRHYEDCFNKNVIHCPPQNMLSPAEAHEKLMLPADE